MTEENRCWKCGAKLLGKAGKEGICPKCLTEEIGDDYELGQ